MNAENTSKQIGHLLDELCVDLGFCLPPEARASLRAAPPADVDAFTDAVFEAEGLDPHANPRLREAVRARVAAYR